MAKEYCGLAEKHDNVSGRVLPHKLVEYYGKKENSLCSVMFVITGYLALVSIVVFMLYKSLPL